MSDQYCRLISELQEAKREINSLRNKNNTLTADNAILESNAATLRRTVNTQKQKIATLQTQNASLSKLQQNLAGSYEDDIEAIKNQIAKREEQISQGLMRNNCESTNVGLLRKQIECEIEQKFAEEIEAKDIKIEGLQDRIDKILRQNEVQKEKYSISLREAHRQIQDLQEKQMKQIKEYAERAYQQSLKRTLNSDESIMKRMRRELDQLRKVVNDKDSQIQSLLDQKNLLLKEKSNAEMRIAKETEMMKQKFDNYRMEVDSSKAIAGLDNLEKDNYRVREQERENRKIKQKNEELHNEIRKYEIKNSDLEVMNAELTHEIKEIKQKHQQQMKQKYKELHSQKQELLRQIKSAQEDCRHYRQKYQTAMFSPEKTDLVRLSKQNQQNTSIQKNTSENKLNRTNVVKQTNIVEQKHIKNISRINREEQENSDSRIFDKSQSRVRQKGSPDLIQKERDKVREIARKYIDLQKKYEIVKKKLKEANQKILELIRSKIDMKSPSKTMEGNTFANSGQQRGDLPTKKKYKERWNSPQPNFATSEKQFFRSASPKERQFYEKSLSIKNRNSKLKDLKCTNHEHLQSQVPT